MSELESKSPFEKMMNNLLLGDGRLQKIEDIHPEDFRIIMDAIICMFFNQKTKKGKKLGLEGLTDYEGTKIEFSKHVQYPSVRKDRVDNFKVIVLPDNKESDELKQMLAREAIKEFDCLETVEKYELCLRILHSFAEAELIILAKEHDPLKRDTSMLEERLRKKIIKREPNK